MATPITIPQDAHGQRLDRWLRQQYPHITFGMVQKWMRTGQVRLDGKRVKGSETLQAGQHLRLPPFAHQEPTGAARLSAKPKLNPKTLRQLQVAVIFQDAQLLVLDKPQGLAVQGGTETTDYVDLYLDALCQDPLPTGGDYSSTADDSSTSLTQTGPAGTSDPLNPLWADRDRQDGAQNRSVLNVHEDSSTSLTQTGPAERVQSAKARLVHRLDKDTSGLLVVAKTYAAARELAALFRDHAVEKTYLAWVVGRPSRPAGRIEAAIGKRQGVDREKMSIRVSDGDEAITDYRCLKSIKWQGETLSLLECRPKTGRTHQLRVHCAQVLDCPILGDGKYGGPRAQPFAKRMPLHLHAWRVVFQLPSSAHTYTFEAPLPPHFEQLSTAAPSRR